MCVIILRLLLILIHDSGDEEGLSAAVTTVSECEADSGVQLTSGEADSVWLGRPGAPSDSQECPSGHTQSSDISESGRVSVATQVAIIYSPFIGS